MLANPTRHIADVATVLGYTDRATSAVPFNAGREYHQASISVGTAKKESSDIAKPRAKGSTGWHEMTGLASCYGGSIFLNPIRSRWV